MSQNKQEIEVSGTDVEAAIEKGLAELSVSRKDVIIEVVDEGSKGLLGIGSRDAVVRLTSMVQPRAKSEPVIVKPHSRPTAAELSQPVQSGESRQEEGDPTEEKEFAATLIKEMLGKMGIEADVSTRLTEPDDLTGKQINVVEINGDDLGVLIGPRGETLNSIQYITRLMAGHKLRRRADFVIDVQGYRRRREQALSRLAERMAKKVSTRRRPVSLEPMPPHERRIIHMTLRETDDVYTQSSGEGKRRKVRIIPK